MNKIDTPHKDYGKYALKWERCRDVSDGQDAVHAKGEKYLPKLGTQDRTDYAAYKCRAGFYNATWRTLNGLLGMMFRKPPTKVLPGALETFEPDIDMAGTSLETLARKVALEVLEVGRIGIMVDYPQADVKAISVAAAEARGLRPMITTYRAECIKNWRFRRVNNRWMLSQVRLAEKVSEPDGEWGEKEVEQIRVLDLDEADQYRVRLFRRKDGNAGEWEQASEFWPLMNNQKMGYIPFAIVGVDGVEAELDEPPLIDLVDLNLAHYRVTADYEHGCHFTGLPTAVVSGYSPVDGGQDNLYIGSTTAWVFPDSEAKAQFLEFTGQGLGALKENLDRKEQQMAILGARMLFAEKRQVEAAETAAIHRSGETSVLAAIATGVSQALEWALGVFRDWAGASGDVTYQLNRDFNPAMLDASQLTALMKQVQMGLMSEDTHWQILQRADIVDSEQTWEKEQERINQQGPVRPVVEAANDGQDGVAA